MYDGWDKTGPRYRAKAKNETERVWNTLNRMDSAAADIATRPGLSELLPAEDVPQMVETVEGVIKNLRRFQRRIGTGVTTTGVTPTCERCGQPFAAMRSDAKFCSTACRVAAHRHRQVRRA
jgi:hypothetical protein